MARYVIDPDRSRVWIDAKSSLHPIHAETSGLEGWLEVDLLGGGRLNPRAPARAELALPVETLSSGNPLYDREMRRRVDARRFPRISGVLTEMRATEREGRYVVSGDVTFRGETHAYTDEMVLSCGDAAPGVRSGVGSQTVRLEGGHEFDIREFGMQPPRILTLRVHPEVVVRVAIVAQLAAERS